MPNFATADAFRNNCALHCFAHTLFSLGDEKIKEIATTNAAAFSLLCEEFKRYYAIEEPIDLDFILQFNKTVTHPYEREIIWGPILRNVLVKLQPEDLQQYVAKDTPIGIDPLTMLATAFGAKLEVNDEANKKHDYLLQEQQHIWTMKLYHSDKGGGHWNFSYPDPSLNEQHNAKYKINEHGQREPIGCAEMWQSANAIGILDQDRAIRLQVHKHIAAIAVIATEDLQAPEPLPKKAKIQRKTASNTSNPAKIEQQDNFRKGMDEARKLAAEVGLPLLWQAAGFKKPIEKDPEKALAAIVTQQMKIMEEIKKNPRP